MLQEVETVPLEQLVAEYLTTRSTIQEKEEAHKKELATLEAKLDTLSTQLLRLCNAQNAESIKTTTGTVSRRIQSRYWTSDWENMYQFIKDHDATYILEKRIHNANMRQFLEENPDLHPAGLQVERKYVIQVRKPTTV